MQFSVDWALADGSSLSEETLEWDTLSAVDGKYSASFTAVDKANNTGSWSVSYTVSNPDPLGSLSESVSAFFAQYGFIVGVAAVLVLHALVPKLMELRST